MVRHCTQTGVKRVSESALVGEVTILGTQWNNDAPGPAGAFSDATSLGLAPILSGLLDCESSVGLQTGLLGNPGVAR